MVIPVAPRFEMPAQTWTSYGCFGTPFCLGGSHQRWKVIFPCHSIWIELSSVKITSSKLSLSFKHLCANSSRLGWLTSFTSWQYFDPVANQPNFLRNFLIFQHENFKPKFVSISCWSLGEVNSSLLSICVSIKCKMSIGTLSFRCGDVADSVWFCLKRWRNFHNPTREISTSSLCKIRNICDGLQPSSFNFMIRSLLWWFSLPIFTCTASSSTYTKCSSRFSRDGKAIPRGWFPSRGTRIPSHGKNSRPAGRDSRPARDC